MLEHPLPVGDLSRRQLRGRRVERQRRARVRSTPARKHWKQIAWLEQMWSFDSVRMGVSFAIRCSAFEIERCGGFDGFAGLDLGLPAAVFEHRVLVRPAQDC